METEYERLKKQFERINKEKILNGYQATFALSKNSKSQIYLAMDEYNEEKNKLIFALTTELNDVRKQFDRIIEDRDYYKEQSELNEIRIRLLEEKILEIQRLVNPCTQIYKKCEYILKK